MKLSIDLNADLGEGSGHDNELFELISSANIATGFHAGDPASILDSIRAAKEKGVAVGAHPSFADRENFGRKEIAVSIPQLFAELVYQIAAFQSLARAVGARPNHVKPHGALYNMAVRDDQMAEAIAQAIAAVDSSLILFAPANSAMERAGRTAELQIARELFADRNYLNDGWLVPRTRRDALLRDPKEAAQRVLRMLREGKVRSVEGHDVEVRGESVCVHGDTPGAVEFARELRTQLEHEGVRISAPRRRNRNPNAA
jgi:5-oxoprolinase (ATP-hydrolysing) subunit A